MKTSSIVYLGLAAPALASLAERQAPEPITISPPTTRPDGAFVVPKDFVSFGIESAFLNNFDNDFSRNLVDSLGERMAVSPILRIGGTSGDYFTFNPAQSEDRVCVAGNCPNGHNAEYSLGPSFFDGYAAFPNARMTLQAPLGNPVNRRQTLDFVTQAWNRLGQGERVASIALGNEVEFIYNGLNGYVNAALDIQAAIISNLSLSGDAARIFEIGNTASGSILNNRFYNGEDILGTNINANGRVSAVAEHWYQISEEPPAGWVDNAMQTMMLNHDAIESRFERYMPSLNAARSRNLDYVINEGAAVLGGAPLEFGCGFGYTLWAVDFSLLAMSRGAAGVTNLAGRPVAKRTFWVPDDTGAASGNPGPHARAPFPAAIMLADFIGDAGPTSVREIQLNLAHLSAYALYNDRNQLHKIAIVNMRLYNGTTNATRNRQQFRISVGTGVRTATARRLRADKGVAAMGFDFGGSDDNVTWAGEQWSFKVDQGNGHFPTGRSVDTNLEIVNGVVTVVIPDSEVVIVRLDQ